MKPKVYIETTVVSYLVARRSTDVILAAHQQITREWWERRGTDFEFFVSSLVMQEAGSGDPEAARLRLEKLRRMPVLLVTDEAETLAYDLAHGGPLPESAAEDALHIALATVHGMDYLLTWNCRHIANAEIQLAAASKCLARGYEFPVICTPEELMGD